MMPKKELPLDNNKINKARALYYNLFASFFVFSKDFKDYLELLKLVNMLKQNSLDANSSGALNDISTKLDANSNAPLIQEYDDIFNSPETKNVRLSASFYDEGFESGKKRLEMIQFVAKTKLRRDEKNFCEYEDSVGFIFSFLAELCDLVASGQKEYAHTIHCVFEQVLNDFVDEFAKSVYEHKSADIYKSLMVALHSFIEFERLFLGVSKPTQKEKVEEKPKEEEISEEERQRRARNKALKAQGPKEEDDACPIDVHYDVETDI